MSDNSNDTNSDVQTGSDLAQQALAQSNPPAASDNDDEIAKSDELADTLMHLQGVIERNAQQLEKIRKEIKEKRELLRNIFENDTELAEAKSQADQYTQQVKERKSKLQADPQSTSLKVQIGEMTQQLKEVEETLSNHLVNYYQLTNSKSFDTSEGDQWEFDVRAKVKGRAK
ncbi:MAG TPA: hypothetical protein VF209_03155 [Patescibacteria group bacterium]